MPLFILGLLLLIGLLAYSIVRYISSAEADQRPVRERYPMAFQDHRRTDGSDDNQDHVHSDMDEDEDIIIDAESYYEEDSLRGDFDHLMRHLSREIRKKAREKNIDIDKIRKKFTGEDPDDDDPENNTVEFPKDNIEIEKKKRGIHSD